MATATQLHQNLLQSPGNRQQLIATATNWLREETTKVTSPEKFLTTMGSERLVRQISPGRMYLFSYDPKMGKKLPYYDLFPLVFPFKRVSGGFYGINMHYLPPLLRAKLMDALYDFSNNQDAERSMLDDTTRLRLSYEILNRSAKHSSFKPCVKHYLNTHVRSRFLWVPANSWDKVLMLPLERFIGASKEKVYRDSRKKI